MQALKKQCFFSELLKNSEVFGRFPALPFNNRQFSIFTILTLIQNHIEQSQVIMSEKIFR